MLRSVASLVRKLREDVQSVIDRDPAARSRLEVVLTTPGLHAIWTHRLAHGLHRRGLPLVARVISHVSRFLTGIEIHPGAQIGRGFFIDHGMGVVIGETAEIGDHVTLYQGVTLGIYHTANASQMRGAKRHPTLRDGVTVTVGAKILGAITIGEGAIVGAGSVVTRDVPPHTTVVGVPGRVVAERDPDTGLSRRIDQSARLNVDLPDPVLEVVRGLHEQVVRLEKRVAELEGSPDLAPTRDDVASRVLS